MLIFAYLLASDTDKKVVGRRYIEEKDRVDPPTKAKNIFYLFSNKDAYCISITLKGFLMQIFTLKPRNNLY